MEEYVHRQNEGRNTGRLGRCYEPEYLVETFFACFERFTQLLPQRYFGGGLITAKAQLVELDLSDNAFGPIGVEGLEGLFHSSVCHTLEILRLNNNGLGITGGKVRCVRLFIFSG